MAFYDPEPWANQARPQGWEQPLPPNRSATSSAVPREDPSAFGSQFEEIDRAVDNLVKSGKLFAGVGGRRDSLPMMGGARSFPDFDPRMGGMGPRHHSISDFDSVRSHSSSNMQGFYANQRFGGRTNEHDGMAQAKRRMAAQRERELRNYHQEQQFNKNVLGSSGPASTRSDRTISPGSLSEEGRRNLIMQQRNALYPGEATPLDTTSARQGPPSAGLPQSAIGRGPSPRNYDPFGMGQMQKPVGPDAASVSHSHQSSQAVGAGATPNVPQQRSRANSTSSPSSNPTSNTFSLFDNGNNNANAHQSSRTSNSSPGGTSPTGKNVPSGTGSSVAPIGTRPAQGTQGVSQATNPALSKGRSTTPLPSPLSHGFTSGDNNERNAPPSSSSAGNAQQQGSQQQDPNLGIGWGNKGGVWGSNKPLGVQASVWG